MLNRASRTNPSSVRPNSRASCTASVDGAPTDASAGMPATIAFCVFFPDVVLWLPKQLLPESVGCFKGPTGVGYICPQ